MSRAVEIAEFGGARFLGFHVNIYPHIAPATSSFLSGLTKRVHHWRPIAAHRIPVTSSDFLVPLAVLHQKRPPRAHQRKSSGERRYSIWDLVGVFKRCFPYSQECSTPRILSGGCGASNINMRSHSHYTCLRRQRNSSSVRPFLPFPKHIIDLKDHTRSSPIILCFQ